MAATDERAIHEFPTGTIDENSLLIMDRPTSTPGEYETEKFAIANLGLKLLGGIDFPSNLDTEEKDIFGAINELHTINGYNYDAYDDTATYAVGDLCIYNNTLYKCTTAITVAEAWNSNHWSQTSIADELSLKQNATDNSLTTTATTIVGAINEINGKLIKRVSATVQLSQVTFTQSSSGMYYYETTLNIPSGSLIVSISCGNWGKLRSTDIIEPYIAGSNKLGLMSNIDSFVSDSVIELIAIYI